MQLDQSNSSTAFAQPEQRPRRSTINSISRSHGPYREQRQRINSDLDADQEDEKPLPLNTSSSSSSNSQPHRLHDSDGASDQWSSNQHTGDQPAGDSQDATPISSPVYRTTGVTNKRSTQRPPPPRLPGHGRSHSDINLDTFSPGFNRSVPSPLASPITATANSLTALSISSSGPYGVSGRDLSKITVPRERRATRPFSVCSTESLLTQDRVKNGFGVSHSTIHIGQLSDSEVSSAFDQGTGGRGSKPKRSHAQEPPSPLLPTASHSSIKKSTGLKSPTVKPASQLRVTLYNLVSNGYLPAETLVVFREHSAVITAKGTLIPQMKEPDAMAIYPWLQDEYETPSAWATAMVKGGRTGKVAVNGWSAIKVPIHQDPELSKKYDELGVAEASLDVFRKKYLANMMEDGDLPVAGDTFSGRSSKDTALLDRKKRKRPLARSGEAAGLRVMTTTGPRGYKGKNEPTRPRKRTVSDVSGMVSSDLLQDRQLRWEAAGVLFSMQDDLMSPTYDGFDRRRTPYQHRWSRHGGIIPLESLERRRQEQESRRRHSSTSRVSALRTLRPLSLVPVAIPLNLTSSMTHMEFCVLCGGSGSTAAPHRRPSSQSNTSHQWSSAESTEPGQSDVKFDRDIMTRCFDCGECYHADCLPSDSSGDRGSFLSDESWRCPRCTTCQICERSVHEHPPTSVTVGVSSSDTTVITETDVIKALVCDQCRKPTHLQCQVVVEPALKPALRSPVSRHTQEWMCMTCRECVECGYRVKRATTESTGNEEGEVSTATDRDTQELVTIEGRWSQGSALCPSCTVLAEKGNVCPLCCTIYQDDDYETPMIFCDGCSHWVHVACDKGLQDRDYEELGEDSKQYFCPSCIPTPIPSPALSSSSSIFSTAHSNDESYWNGSCGHGLFGGETCNACSKETQTSYEDDWRSRNSRKKDDIFDLLRAAKEISDSESRATSPYSSYSPMFPSTHSRTMSASLESVAEVAAAEALLTIFSGASTPVSSTPYTSYPPSPYEPSFNGSYDRQYSVVNSPHEHILPIGSMAFTPSSDQESIGSLHDRYSFPQEDYFNSRPHPRPSIPYQHIGQELELASVQSKLPLRQAHVMDDEEEGDVIMEEGRAGLQSPRASVEPDVQPPSALSSGNGVHSDLYRPLVPPHHGFQRHSSSDAVPTVENLSDIVDTRACLLCHEGCKDSSNGSLLTLGRLLPLTLRNPDISRQGANSDTQSGWVHSNCALWSTGVTLEATGGGMENVARIVSQSLHVCCSSCGRPGASIKCKTSASAATDNPNACIATFHYPCVNHLDQLQHQGQAANNAVIMDQKQRTILCSMHYREISTLNDLRSAAFALHSSGPSTDNAAPPTHPSSLVPPVTLRTSWLTPFWIKDSSLVLEGARTEAAGKEATLGGFRIGGLTIHTLGRFDSPESAYSETGLANDVDLEACYRRDSDKPLTDLRSRDRVLALPLGFKCSRRILLGGYHSCTATAEVIQYQRQSEGSVKTLATTNAAPLVHARSEELKTGWKITLMFSRSNNHEYQRDRDVFADSMQDAVERIFSIFNNGVDNDSHQPRQYGLYLRSADAFFGLNHPLVRNSIRAMTGEKEVASRMWTRYREIQRVVERQCRKHECFRSSHHRQRKDTHADEDGEWESTTAARVRSRPGSFLSRKRISRIGIARSGDLPTSIVAEPRDNPLVPGLLQELIKASISTPATTTSRVDAPAMPAGTDKTHLDMRLQGQKRQDSSHSAYDDRPLPSLKVSLDQLQSLHADQSNNVALFWKGRRMTSTHFATEPTHTAQPPEDPTQTVSAIETEDDKEESVLTPEDIDVDKTTQSSSSLYFSGSRPKLSSHPETSQPTVESHSDVRVYTARSFQPDEVIMEYTGEVVHPSIAVRRQELYQSQGRSCYMMWCEFQDAVIDATKQGGLARYIRNENQHLRKQNNPQQQRTVYARTVSGSGIHGPRVVICAAGPLEVGSELILRYC
ncbi:hypothetical protein BGZ95_011472 [Linnemannia exigua]|uniref:Uncharacterized protein n=1 Tax=Linnemannia exigua TaxID=604196 RepID=A0AAD4D9U5_9FUNG|nr:hypothetical protein BGZ95_011472 [Linnemannia exigua]